LIVTALIALIAIIAIGFFHHYWLVPIIVSLLVLLSELVFFLLRNLIWSEREERLERGYSDVAGAPAPRPGADLPASFRRCSPSCAARGSVATGCMRCRGTS
jgi:hypothetical protein